MVPVHRNKQFWRAAVIAGAVCAAAAVAAPSAAQAEGFFDFLFGGFRDRAAPPRVTSYAEPGASIGRVSPAPLGPESVHQGGGGGGRAVSFCVRLCDGQHFPMEHMVNATPVETCRAMCPTSKTKVFFGNAIGGAVARDGQRYADLDNAFSYQKQLVANCTCNGKDAFGLARLDVRADPTLRPGDIVMTKTGPVAFSGKRGATATFTPVDAAVLAAELTPGAPRLRLRLSRRNEQTAADDEPGTIVQSQNGPQWQPAPVDLRGQVGR